MVRYNENESEKLCLSWGITPIPRELEFIAFESSECVAGIPQSSRGIAVLAGLVTAALANHGKICIYVTLWGVWPTEESWTLFEHAMAGYQDSRPLIAAPGFVFEASEIRNAQDILRFGILCGWDILVASERGKIAFEITHDEELFVVGDSYLISEWTAHYHSTLET